MFDGPARGRRRAFACVSALVVGALRGRRPRPMTGLKRGVRGG